MTANPHKHLSESLGRESSIDSLRGLAALSVLIHHALILFWIGLRTTYHHYGLRPNLSAMAGYFSAPFNSGGLGVTLFFVLSGYCIHRRGASILVKDPQAKLDYRTFASRRFWRIYPTYVAALLLTALIDWWITAKMGIKNPTLNDSPFSFGVSLLALQGYLAPFFGSNGVFWTLAMEIHLYLAYPLLFFLSKRIGPQKTLLFTLAVGLIYLTANVLFGIDKYFPYRFQRGPVFLPYWFTWTAGFYLAEIEAGRVRDFGKSAWGLIMAAGVVIGLPLSILDFNIIAEMFWTLFFGGLLHWSLEPVGKQFWSGKLGLGLAFIGVFSYSLYAIHAPLLFLLYSLVTPDNGYKFVTLWPALIAAGCTIPLTWLFFYSSEWWSIRKSNKSFIKNTK